MNTTAVLRYGLAGQPAVKMSTGVPVLGRHGHIARNVRVQIRTLYPSTPRVKGGFDFSLEGPGIEPGLQGFDTLESVPYGHAVADSLHALLPACVDIVAMGAPAAQPFWVQADSSDGTHVLKDHASSRLVLVKALPAALRRPFWKTIIDVCRSGFPPQHAEVDVWDSDTEGQWRESAGGGVWLCLNPAPHMPDRPVLWDFDTAEAALFDLEGGREIEEELVAGELLCGPRLAAKL